MFRLKTKGSPKETIVNELHLRLRGQGRVLKDDKLLSDILGTYAEDEIEIRIDGKYKKAWNIYFKDFNDSWLCEGVDG